MPVRIVRSRRAAMRHAPRRAACGAVVARVAVCGAGGVCDRAVAACGDASCTDARGVWRRRGAGSCVWRSGDVLCVRAHIRLLPRHDFLCPGQEGVPLAWNCYSVQ